MAAGITKDSFAFIYILLTFKLFVIVKMFKFDYL